MARKTTSWREKLHKKQDLPKVVAIDEKMSRRWGEGTCVIPAPIEVDERMRMVTRGKVTTSNEIRAYLARKHGATIACPMTTGIFAWIAAGVADEAALEGEKDITPYWRTLKKDGELNPKYPGGVVRQTKMLEEERHKIIPSKDKKAPREKDWDKKLVEL